MEIILVDFLQIYPNFRMNIEGFTIHLIFLSTALKLPAPFLPMECRVEKTWFTSDSAYWQHWGGGQEKTVKNAKTL